MFLLTIVPARAQWVEGNVEVVHDPYSQTIVVSAYTDSDYSTLVDYQLKMDVTLYRNGAVQFSGLVASSSSIAQGEWTFIAYPDSFYDARALHTVEAVYSAGGGAWYDPIGYSFLPTPTSGRTPPDRVYGPLLVLFPPFRDYAVTRTEASTATPLSLLTVTSNGVIVPQGGSARFDAAPTTEQPLMPNMVAQLSGVHPLLSVLWTVRVNYIRADSGYVPNTGPPPIFRSCSRGNSGMPQPYADAASGLPANLFANQPYNISSAFQQGSLPNRVQGGTVTLTYQVAGTNPWIRTFNLLGRNPSSTAVRALINSNPAAPWYAANIAAHESGGAYRQFNTQAGIDGTPNFGGPCGFGIMQIDPPRQVGDVWSWMINVNTGVNFMIDVRTRAQQSWRDSMRDYRAALASGVPPQKPPCNEQVGSATPTTFCAFSESVPNTKPMTDAIAIKFYNSGPNSVPYVKFDLGSRSWRFSRTNGSNFNYVQRVLNTQP